MYGNKKNCGLQGLTGGAVLVITGLRGLGQEHNKDDLAHAGEEAQQEIPGGLAGVMEPAETHGQTGNQQARP